MRNEKDGHAALLHLSDPSRATMLKNGIADRQSFVDDQYPWAGADRDRESQADVHAARIRLDRLINELANFGEAFDLRNQSFRFAARKPDQGRIHENVFQAGKLRIESGPELQQGGDPALVPDGAVGGLERAGDDLQQSGFAAAVRPDDSSRGPRFDLKTDILQRPEFTVTLPEPARKHLLQAIAWMVIHSILLGNAFNAERSVHVVFEIGSVVERLRTERKSVKQGENKSPRDPLMTARALHTFPIIR